MSEPAPFSVTAPEGVVSHPSAWPLAQTVARIEQAVTGAGLTLFDLIDHSGEAERIGMAMLESKLLIFGSPRAGTPLMAAAPLLALDLPLRALVWRDTRGQVWVSYTDPAWLARRYGVPAHLLGNIAAMEPLIAAAIQPEN
ncbi:MAG: DUF302 domain-containing protein [Chloroflexota bacterium]|nr:DUF302 domain-containing protein [Chloroflexota bacterium]